jgi:hypothetical protein
MSFAGAFADGGSFTVAGSPSGDKNLVSLLANAGEEVSVTKGGGGARTVNLVYNAAKGESEATARNNARAMLEIMARETSRL